MSGITNPAEPYFKDGTWGWDGAAWRKLPLVFGYSDRWYEDLSGTKSGDGTYEAFATAVDAGYIYVLQGASIANVTGARGRAHVKVFLGTDYIDLAYKATPAIEEPTMFSGAIVLKEGDRANVVQVSCLNNDVVKAGVWGYKMKVAE